ncbi:hypothetical protein [Blastococcus sp. SYSU DS1024]
MTTVELFVDWSLVGQARRFRTRVPATVRRQLHRGDTVRVVGDDIAPTSARVLAVDDPEVELELLDQPGPQPRPRTERTTRTEVDLDAVRAEVARFEAAHPGIDASNYPDAFRDGDGRLTESADFAAVDELYGILEIADHPNVGTALRGAHADPGPTSEVVRAADRAEDEELAARRLAALDKFLDEYEAAHGPISAEEMNVALRRLRARGGRTAGTADRTLPPALVWRQVTAAELEDMREQLRAFEDRYGKPSAQMLEVAEFRDANGELVETDDLMRWSSLWDRYRPLTEP